MRTYILPALLLLAHAVTAQPLQYGCHFFRNGPPHPPHALSQDERAAIDDVIARSDTFDILHYDLALDVTRYSTQKLYGAATITYVPLMPDQTFIRFELQTLTVDSVSGSGGALTFSQGNGKLRVDLPEANVGTTYAITVHYHGTPDRDPDWGGFYFESGYSYNLGIGLTTIPPNFGKVWYPCFDSFVERASYTYHVKSAGTFRAHCQGNFLGEEALAGDTVVRSYDLPYAIPTHISAVAVADYRDSTFVHTGAYGDIPVTLTAKPAQLNAMVNKFVNIGDAIDAYEFWYGPYPYGRVGYVLTTDGALEIPENVAYPDFMPSQSVVSNRALFGHELGHHWWGDLVTPRTHNDMWLKEGPAEYSAHLLEEWIGGEDAFVDAVKENQYKVLTQAHVQDGGFQPLSPMPDPYIYGIHTYNKGAAVMHNLRGYLGDTLFRQACHAVLQAHANTAWDAYQFRDALEAATGRDMHPFFDAQVFAPGFSVFVVRSMQAQANGGQWNVDLDVRQRLRGTTVYHEQVPIDLTLIGADGASQEYQVTVSGETTPVNVTCAFQPVIAVMNGHNRLDQARMDYELTIHPGVSFPSLLPRTDFRIFPDSVPDSAFIRVEHIWAGPEQDDVDWGIYQVSSTHYWTVDGLWPEGLRLHSRIYYAGHDTTDLDHDLFGTSEANALLVYRATPTDPWSVYPDFTLHSGGLTDGAGYLTIDVLRKGQYAFANGHVVAGIEAHTDNAPALTLAPNPAHDLLAILGDQRRAGTLTCDLYGGNGELVQRHTHAAAAHFRVVMDLTAVAPGAYILQVRDDRGELVGRAHVDVLH